jgi:hypothetical protein
VKTELPTWSIVYFDEAGVCSPWQAMIYSRE